MNDLMLPIDAIERLDAIGKPNVWLTSFYAFTPEEWGVLSFTQEFRRKSFIRRSEAGVLVVVYGAKKEKKDEYRKILGIQQCSHQSVDSQQFISPSVWTQKDNEGFGEKWNFGVKVTRAWRVSPESRMNIQAFSPDTYSTGRANAIGAQCMQLTQREAHKILDLDLQEVSVYGETPIIASVSVPAKQIFSPSKAGPVSQLSYSVKEAEGPKHLYILKLHGDTDAFLGKPANGKIIIKAGFSKSPATRCKDFNNMLPPNCAFYWEILYSSLSLENAPYPTSAHAKAGERMMQTILCKTPDGESLGGEFFLAKQSLIDKAWEDGNASAASALK